MKLLIIITFAGLLLANLSEAGSTRRKTILDKTDYRDFYFKYKSKHDIVSLLVPPNALNFKEDDNNTLKKGQNVTFFFVEADVNANGGRTYQGLYVYRNETATKLLDNGRDAAASRDHSKQVFFGAADGIYEYKSDTNEAVKYGSVSDSIIGIAKINGEDIFYILTEDHELYKVKNKGNTKTKVNEVVNAQEIVLDYLNNVYFYSNDKKPYVLTANGLKEIKGIPANPKEVKLVKPPFLIQNGVPSIIDDTVYILYANGTSKETSLGFTPGAVPTAAALESTVVLTSAYDKKIYLMNLVSRVIDAIVFEFKYHLRM